MSTVNHKPVETLRAELFAALAPDQYTADGATAAQDAYVRACVDRGERRRLRHAVRTLLFHDRDLEDWSDAA